MFVRTYLMILVLGCAACGISLYFGIKFIGYEVEQAAEAKSESALLISDFRRLEESFAQWLVLTDLVLGADETYLSAGAVDLGEKIHHLSNEIKFVAPESTFVSFGVVNSFTKNQTDRLQKATELNSERRDEKLNQLLAASDEESENAFACLQLIKEKLDEHLVSCNEAYKSTIRGRGVRNAGLLFCFASCVYGMWLWVSKIVSHPISKLSDATRQALVDRELRADPSKGPREVRLLTSVFSELFSDLTDQIELQKKTQKEREALYEKLVDTSRRAGMAEVATGVLHNVGNVLNSVKVAASVARDSAKKSIVAQLQATNEIIASQDDLADFLTNDARGKRFPEALGYLSDGLACERDTQLNELETLLDRVDHIDEIVKSQQVFAKSDACLEMINLNDLLEHAIGIKRPSFAKSGVVIVRHFDEPISIKTEKHRLLQVIVNLLTNALEAIEMCEDNRREINVHLKRSGQRVIIQVQDSGIGISPKNLNQLFNHGFTTKEDGHGFGLHSSAIAVQALGASLKVESEGETHGATFTVDLPIEQSELCKV